MSSTSAMGMGGLRHHHPGLTPRSGAPVRVEAMPSGHLHFRELGPASHVGFLPSPAHHAPGPFQVPAGPPAYGYHLGPPAATVAAGKPSAFDLAFWDGFYKKLKESEEVEVRDQLKDIYERTHEAKGEQHSLQQEVLELRDACCKQSSLIGKLHAQVEGIAVRVERRLQYIGESTGDSTTRHAGALTDLDRRLNELASQVAEIGGNVAHLKGSMASSVAELKASLTSSVGDLKGSLKHHGTLHAGQTSMEGRLEQLDKALPALDQRQQRQLDKTVVRLDEAGKRLGAECEAVVTALGKRVDVLEERTVDAVSGHSRALEKLRAALERQGKEAQARHGTAQEVQQMQMAMELRLCKVEKAEEEAQVIKATVRTVINRLEAQMEDSRASKQFMADIGRHIEAHAALAQRLSTLETDVGHHVEAQATAAQRVSTVEAAVEDSSRKQQGELRAVSDRMDRMSGSGDAIDALRRGQTDLQRDLASRNRRSAELADRLDAVEKSLTEANEDQSRKLEAVKAAQGRLASESRGHVQQMATLTDKVESVALKHGAVEDQLAQIERKGDDAADRHGKEIAALKAAQSSHLQVKHVPLEEALESVRQTVSRAGERQAATAAALEESLQGLKEGLSEEQRASQRCANDLNLQRDELGQHQAALEGRLVNIDKRISDAGEQHQCQHQGHEQELVVVKDVNTKLTEANVEYQARLEKIEGFLKGFSHG